MSDSKSSNNATTQLTNQVTQQADEISMLRTRLNQIVDNIAVLENDIGRFKKNVSKDLLEVIDVVKENRKR